MVTSGPVLVALVLMVAFMFSTAEAAQLVPNFYQRRCRNAEYIITSAVNKALDERPAAAAGVVRIHFHDCFVQGCDASVLIDSTTDSQSEKAAFPNLSLQGFDVIDAAKTAIEEICPGMVSCADITAIAAQLSVKKLSRGAIQWKVRLGRRDGLVSSVAAVGRKLPAPTANLATLKSTFAAVGLSTSDMVALSGAHSVGMASCGTFQNRLTSSDPTLNPIYAASLKQQCPIGSNNRVNLDVTTPTTLDEMYYKNLQGRKGLLTSDQVLFEEPETKGMVARLAKPGVFKRRFAAAMVKMGNIGVLTGNQGEVRLNCHRFNPRQP